MQNLEALRRTIASTVDLGAVVRTMKAFAAVNIRQYEQAVESLSTYNAVVETGLQIVLRDHLDDLPRGSDHLRNLGAVVFGSDTGLCGRFNEQIVDHALSHLARTPGANTRVMAVGLRAAAELEVKQEDVEQVLTLPNSLATLTQVVQAVLLRFESWERQVDRLVLFHNKPTAAGSFEPHSVQVYPLDPDWLRSLAGRPWQSRSLPTYSMTRDALLATLVREFFFVSCYRALAESLASENAARLAAMQAAEKNIDSRLGILRLEFNQQRQNAITEELLDIIAGAEVLAGSFESAS